MSDLGNKEVMARNIKYYLKTNDVTQTEMCNTLGFKMSTVSDWIHARTYPRINKIEMMANYFGIEKSDLIEKKSSSTELNKRGTKQIEEIIQQTKNKLTSQEGLMFDGDPASPEVIESILSTMEIGMEMAKKKNKKNTHLKNIKRTDVNGHKKDCKFACQETPLKLSLRNISTKCFKKNINKQGFLKKFISIYRKNNSSTTKKIDVLAKTTTIAST